MSEQEEYLDRLLKGLNEGSEEEALEDFSFEDFDMNDIDEDSLFDEESSELEDVTSLGLEGMQQELDSELDVSEFGLGEDDFQLDEEDLDFAYEETEGEDLISDVLFGNEEKDLDPALDALFENEADEADEAEDLTEPEAEMDEPQMFEEPEAEMGEPQMFEESEMEMGEIQMSEETEQDDGMFDMGLDSLGNETELEEEMSDTEALANILNTFSDDEGESSMDEDLTEEEAFEEAVLDTPEDLGLELEEVEELTEFVEEEEPQGKKKKEKKKKEKKKKVKKEKVKKEDALEDIALEEDILAEDTLEDIVLKNNSKKKPSLFARLLADNEDDEPTPEELEEAKAKKAELEEKKQAKKAAAEERKQLAKEAAATKKAAKEAEKRRKKEMEEPPEPWPPFTKKVIPMIFLFGAAVVALVIIFSNVLSYSPYLSNARKYFDNRQYEKAYEQLLGIEIREKDGYFYRQVLLMHQLQVKVISSKNHLLNQERELAVNDLVQAVLFYNDNLEKAEELGLIKEFQVVYADIESDLSETFGISVKDAEALGAITDAIEYQERIAEIVK